MTHDLITVGRVTMDFHAQDIGVPFEDVTGFDTMVGGSPTNVAIGTARLGLRSAAFTAVGDDLAGDFVMRYLSDNGVDTTFVARKPGKRTSLAMVAVLPPDRFPLSFYREDPADIYLTVEDATALPFDDVRALLLSGDAFSRGSCVEAARYCGEQAGSREITTYMDLDLRPTDWQQPRDYGRALRDVLSLADVAVGTEEEFYAALAPDPDAVIAGEPIDAAARTALEGLLESVMRDGSIDAIVVKRGARGVTVITPEERLEVPSFDVDAVNTVGAGDAFASGLIRGRAAGWGWQRSTRFASACGAIQVTRHGCSAAFPTEAEAQELIDMQGGS